MDAEDRRLLLDIHGKVSGIEPALRANVEALNGLDERQRKSEIVAAEHGIKIERLQGDLDGLGRKVRWQSDRTSLKQASGHETGRWLAFLEVAAALPRYAHVALSLGSLIVAAAVIIAKMSGHTVTHP